MFRERLSVLASGRRSVRCSSPKLGGCRRSRGSGAWQAAFASSTCTGEVGWENPEPRGPRVCTGRWTNGCDDACGCVYSNSGRSPRRCDETSSLWYPRGVGAKNQRVAQGILAAREHTAGEQSPRPRLLAQPRATELDGSLRAEFPRLHEPPYAERHLRWCGRTGARRTLLPDRYCCSPKLISNVAPGSPMNTIMPLGGSIAALLPVTHEDSLHLPSS